MPEFYHMQLFLCSGFFVLQENLVWRPANLIVVFLVVR